jgi:hypothetical protein
MPRYPTETPAAYPAVDWNRNKPIPGNAIEPYENPDVGDQSAPWATEPDEETEDGQGPRPMAVPEDLYSEPETEESKQEPKGTVFPVWLCLTLAVLASVVGANSVSGPATATGAPPTLLFDPTAPLGGTPPVLPNLPVVPAVPCPQDAACEFIMGSVDRFLPPQTRALINVPGTCQNWSREWLRTGKDIMEFQVERIRQRFAMALMYCEFNGDNWLESELWVSDLHECDWYTMIGVDPCGRREQYQIIRNYGQQMRGTLPPEISMLSSLWEISLSDNLIEGTIPSDFYKLSELDTLSLSFNLFKGTIPEFMWEYEDMNYMDLAYNFFTGTIPNTVHLTEPNLNVLFVENNDLAGTIPETFGDLNWKRLHMDGNQFNGPIPAGINSPRMEELMLHNNQLTGGFPASAFANDLPTGTSKLRQVTIYNNDVTGDVNEMCSLFTTGSLETFEVDKDKVLCDCCAGAP